MDIGFIQALKCSLADPMIVLEEHIEELTTYSDLDPDDNCSENDADCSDEEEEEAKENLERNCHKTVDYDYGLAFKTSNKVKNGNKRNHCEQHLLTCSEVRVPFPEFGIDLIDGRFHDWSSASKLLLDSDGNLNDNGILNIDDSSDCSFKHHSLNSLRLQPSVRVTDLLSWEENWLFQKKQKATGDIAGLYTFDELPNAIEPSRLLIPNPSQLSMPKIGSLEIDQISDMSEQNSGESLCFSDDEIMDEDEDEDADKEAVNESDTGANSGDNEEKEDEARQEENDDEKEEGKVTFKNLLNNGKENNNCLCKSDDRNGDQSRLQNTEETNPHSIVKSTDLKEQLKSSSKSTVNSVQDVHCKKVVNQNAMDTFRKSYETLQVIKTQDSQKQLEAVCIEAVPKNVPVPNYVPCQLRRLENGIICTDPDFVIPPRSATVQCSILIQFYARVCGSKPLGAAWFHEDIRIENGSDYRIVENSNDYILEIRKTKPHLSGHYSCVVFNNLDQRWVDFELKLKQPSQTNNFVHRKSPVKRANFIQRTWAEREAEEAETEAKKLHKENFEQEQLNHANEPPSLMISSNGKQVIEQPTRKASCTDINMEVLTTVNPVEMKVAEREMKKWVENTVAWPNNPYTSEEIEKRRQATAASPANVQDLLQAKQSFDSLTVPVVQNDCFKSLSEENSSDNQPSDISEAMPVTKILISPSKDSTRFQRDYYVHLEDHKDEALNGLDEKVYSTSRYFSLDEHSSKASVDSIVDTSSSNSVKNLSSSLENISISVKDLVSKFNDGSDGCKTNVKRRSTIVGNSVRKCSLSSASSECESSSSTVTTLSSSFSPLPSESTKNQEITASTSTSSSSNRCKFPEVKLRHINVNKVDNNSSATANYSNKVSFQLCTWSERELSPSICSYSGYSSPVNSNCLQTVPSASSSIDNNHNHDHDNNINHNLSRTDAENAAKVHSISGRNMTKLSAHCKDGISKSARQSNLLRSQSLFEVNNSRVNNASNGNANSQEVTEYKCEESNESIVLQSSPSSSSSLLLSTSSSSSSDHKCKPRLVTKIDVKSDPTSDQTIKLQETGKKISRSILERAFYWEKRCEFGLLSDNHADCQQFPAMQHVYD